MHIQLEWIGYSSKYGFKMRRQSDGEANNEKVTEEGGVKVTEDDGVNRKAKSCVCVCMCEDGRCQGNYSFHSLPSQLFFLSGDVR